MVSSRKINKRKTKNNKKIKGGEHTYNDNGEHTYNDIILGGFLKAIDSNEIDIAYDIIETYPDIVNGEFKVHKSDNADNDISITPFINAIQAYFGSGGGDDEHYTTEMIEMLLYSEDSDGNDIGVNIASPDNQDFLYTIVNFVLSEETYKYNLDLIKILYQYSQDKNIDFTTFNTKYGESLDDIDDDNMINTPLIEYTPVNYAIYIMSVNTLGSNYIGFPDEYAVEYLKILIDMFKPKFDQEDYVVTNDKWFRKRSPLHLICNYTNKSIFHAIYHIVRPEPERPNYEELINLYNTEIREREERAMNIFKLILDNTKNVNIKDSFGLTPIQYISALTRPDIKDSIIDQLIKKGSKPIDSHSILQIYDILGIKDNTQPKPILGITTEINLQEEIFDFISLEEKTIDSIIKESNDNIIFKYETSSIFCNYEQLVNALNNLSNIIYECKYPNGKIEIYEYTGGIKHLFLNMRALGLPNQIVNVGELLTVLRNIERQKEKNEPVTNQIFVLQPLENIDSAFVSVNVLKGGSWVGASHCQDLVSVDKCEIKYVIKDNNEKPDQYIHFMNEMYSDIVNSRNNSSKNTRKRKRGPQSGGKKINKTSRKNKKTRKNKKC